MVWVLPLVRVRVLPLPFQNTRITIAESRGETHSVQHYTLRILGPDAI